MADVKLGERMAKIEEKQDQLKESFDEFKVSHKEDMASLKKTVIDFIASADKRYANKETEKFVNKLKTGVVTLVGIILFAILAGVIAHVFGLDIK